MSQERFHQIIEGVRGYWHYKGGHILIHFDTEDLSHVKAHQFNPLRGGPIFGSKKWFIMMCLIWYADAILVQSFTSNLDQNYIFESLESGPKLQFDL